MESVYIRYSYTSGIQRFTRPHAPEKTLNRASATDSDCPARTYCTLKLRPKWTSCGRAPASAHETRGARVSRAHDTPAADAASGATGARLRRVAREGAATAASTSSSVQRCPTALALDGKASGAKQAIGRAGGAKQMGWAWCADHCPSAPASS